MPGILHEFITIIHQNGLLKSKEIVLVGCSGGPDSIALFYLLLDIAREYELSLYMAHLNHGIRKDADADEAFVRQVAEAEGIKMVAEKVDCRELSKKWKMSLEGAARKARHAFFERHAKSLGASKVALGHTADDQAETILMRLIRGAGLKGMAGMSPITCIRGIHYIRPLIRCQKSEVLEYLSFRNLTFRTDETNLEPFCTRNRIRLTLIPFLKKEFNPSIVHTLSKTAELLREDHFTLQYFFTNIERKLGVGFQSDRSEHGVRQGMPWAGRSGKKAHSIDLEMIRSQPIGIQRRIIQKWLLSANVRPVSVHFVHIQALIDLINRSAGGGELYLPGGMRVYKEARQLWLMPQASQYPQNESGDRIPDEKDILNIPGETHLPQFSIVLKTSFLSKGTWKDIPSDPNIAFLDADTLLKPLRVRSRLPGDRFQPLGISVEKKLKEFFIDSKVPRRMRDKWPLLVGDSKILWVLGLRIGHPYRITSHTEEILRLEFDFSQTRS